MLELARRELIRKRLHFQLDTANVKGFAKCLGSHPENAEQSCHPHGLRIPCWKLYKCLYCGFYFCETCAEVHFGKSRQQYETEQFPSRTSGTGISSNTNPHS